MEYAICQYLIKRMSLNFLFQKKKLKKYYFQNYCSLFFCFRSFFLSLFSIVNFKIYPPIVYFFILSWPQLGHAEIAQRECPKISPGRLATQVSVILCRRILFCYCWWC